MPPVSPTFSIRPVSTYGHAALSRSHGIDHEHGDGEGPDAAWNRGVGAGTLHHIDGVHVADQHVALAIEGCEFLRRVAEDAGGEVAVLDAIGTDIDDGGAWLDEVAGDHGGAADGGDEG